MPSGSPAPAGESCARLLMTSRAERWRIRRDVLIVSFSLVAAAVELFVLGARPAALAFITGLIVSPVAFRLDEFRRRDPS
jgi:hypothetical protein